MKYIVPYISMIEAVDSLKLLREIEKQAAKCGRVIDVLLELHIAEESTKYGLTLDDCRQLLADGEWREMKHVRICGLMMMASNVDDEQQIASEFQQAADFFDEVKAKYFADAEQFCERSWGMSDDYPDRRRSAAQRWCASAPPSSVPRLLMRSKMILVAPIVKRVPSSIIRRSRPLISMLSTNVPVLLLLSLSV